MAGVLDAILNIMFLEVRQSRLLVPGQMHQRLLKILEKYLSTINNKWVIGRIMICFVAMYEHNLKN